MPFSLTPLDKKYVLIVMPLVMILTGFGFLLASRNVTQPDRRVPPVVDQASIDNGCDIGGGYVWCQPKQKCLRLYEEKCEGTVTATDAAQLHNQAEAAIASKSATENTE